MTVELLYFDGCPNWDVAEERLRVALDRVGHGDIVVDRIVVEDRDHADRLGFIGSPTVRVNGRDPFATGEARVGFTCRVYSGPTGPSGSPTVEQFMEVLA